MLRLPSRLARLPELDLVGAGLARAQHTYAHGGFMGAALSLLSDPEWATILLSSVGEDDPKVGGGWRVAVGRAQREHVLQWALGRRLQGTWHVVHAPVSVSSGTAVHPVPW